MNWQPIETAPDEVWILTYHEGFGLPIGVSQYRWVTRVEETVESESRNSKGRRKIVQEVWIREREWDGAHWEATHWMPLPEPPTPSP